MMNLLTASKVELIATATEMGLVAKMNMSKATIREILKAEWARLAEEMRVLCGTEKYEDERDESLFLVKRIFNGAKREVVQFAIAMGEVIARGPIHATKIEEEVIMENVKVIKEEVVAPVVNVNVYSVGAYVINTVTSKLFKVGEEYVVGDKTLVHTFQFVAKGSDLKRVDMTIANLNNTKLFTLLTNAEVVAEIAKTIKTGHELNVSTDAKGYRSWTTTDLETKVVTELKEGHSVTSKIREWKMTHNGHTMNVTLGAPVAAKTKAVETKVEATRKCSCCGKVVSEKQHTFIKNNQRALTPVLRGKDYCFNCQDKVVDPATDYSVKFLIKKAYAAKKAKSVSITK